MHALLRALAAGDGGNHFHAVTLGQGMGRVACVGHELGVDRHRKRWLACQCATASATVALAGSSTVCWLMVMFMGKCIQAQNGAAGGCAGSQ